MAEVKWETLGRKLTPAWGSERAANVRRDLTRRRARRALVSRLVIVGAAMLCVAGVFWGWQHRTPATKGPMAVAPSAVPALESADLRPATPPLPVVIPLSPTTEVEALADPWQRSYALRRGAARFEVPHDPLHPFTLVARGFVVEDLGTIFEVALEEPEALTVSVEEGRVRVREGERSVELGPGERAHFVSASAGPPNAPRPLVSPRKPSPPSHVSPPSSWRQLAEKGDYDEAFAALQQEGPGGVRDETGDLLLAADATRLSGHPADALRYLRQIVQTHGNDPRAGLAAFTLGRVLLEELGRPGEAAEAFGRARAVGGPMAEDALAREVEAYSRAGDATKSRDLAREYVTLYPHGRRSKAVIRFGGLE